MPVALYISWFCLGVQGILRNFPEFSCFPKQDPTRDSLHRVPWNPSRWGLRSPIGPTRRVIAADGPAYIAFRHHAVVSMLRNFVLSPRER
jgi:hypothetical protein